MSMNLPLFPLPNVVLFPGMLLPLHIFEARYRTMMHDVLAEDARFGVMLCKEYNPATCDGLPFEIGTIAEIVQYEELEDGRYNVLVVGSQRYMVDYYQPPNRQYLQGDVIILEDDKEVTVPKRLIQETVDLFREARRLTHKVTGKTCQELIMPDDAESTSFFIAENLRGSLVLKQDLLEMTCTKDRLSYERSVLRKMVKTLAVRTQIEAAFGNL